MTVHDPCCVDLYGGDDVSDSPHALSGLDQAKHSGIFALIHKATEGTRYVDQRYDARRAKWMAGGGVGATDVDGTSLILSPLWGAYHFLHGGDPENEAKNFLRASRLGPRDMAFLDWEAVGASGHQPSVEAADAFCQDVEEALGRPCGIYGGNAPREKFDDERPSDAILERFAARPLWLCAYGPYSPERLHSLTPLPWKEPGVFLWQDDGDKYGPGPHSVPGVRNYCDNSTVVEPMTLARLHALWTGE